MDALGAPERWKPWIPAEVMSKEELRGWVKASDARGVLAVATTWALIAGSFAAVIGAERAQALGLIPGWAFWGIVLLAWILLGGRHLALGILMHEAAHRSLFRTPRLNDLIGSWLCAYPTWQDLHRYRTHHLRHHRYGGTDQDPDLDLVTAYPTTGPSLLRKFARDWVGITGLRRIVGLLLVDFGFYEFTVSSLKTSIPGARERSLVEILRCGFKNLHGVVLTNLVLGLLLTGLGHPELYALWLWAYLSPFSVFVRIRSIAEHAVTARSANPLACTRTTQAHFWERLTVAPHRVNFHLEHHLLMAVPYFKLPAFHQRLRDLGVLQGAHLEPDYAAVLRKAASAPRASALP